MNKYCLRCTVYHTSLHNQKSHSTPASDTSDEHSRLLVCRAHTLLCTGAPAGHQQGSINEVPSRLKYSPSPFASAVAGLAHCSPSPALLPLERSANQQIKRRAHGAAKVTILSLMRVTRYPWLAELRLTMIIMCHHTAYGIQQQCCESESRQD